MSLQAESYTAADGQTYRMWRANEDDKTSQHLMYPNGYSAKCDHCYFGHSHSVAAHEAEIKRKSGK